MGKRALTACTLQEGVCISNPLAAAKLKAETAYNAAADNFDAEPLGFWGRYGRRTVERLRLQHGAHVLDVVLWYWRFCFAGGTGRRLRGPRDRGRILRANSSNWEHEAQAARSSVWTSAMGTRRTWAFPIVILTQSSVCLGFSLSRTWSTRWGNCGAWYGLADNWRSPRGAHDFRSGVRGLVGGRAPGAPRTVYCI